MRKHFVLRTRILCGCFVFAALLILVRLYFVQIVHGASYQNEATAQYIEPNPDTEDRGDILFTTKDGEHPAAAQMQSGWRIAITPKDIVDAPAVYAELNAITPVDEDRFLDDAAKVNDSYEEVAFQVSDAAGAQIQALNIPGVLLVADQWRFYPGHQLAAQAIGFVGYEGTSTSRSGEYGLEKEYQDTLSEPTSGLYVNPFAEIFTNVQDIVATNPAAQHGSIITSIDPEVQAQLEKTLDGVMKTYSSQFAGGIIMDPHTGEIYAIGGTPSFDPNTYGDAADPVDYQDRLVEGRYEMGSIMKPLTMAAGIDSGAITADTTYDDMGCIGVSGYKVCNYDLKARGVIPMQQILSQSLNVGASWVATKTGYPTFTKYMNAYGFGEKTGIDLPDEVTGDLSNLGSGNLAAVNYDTAAFGQGISVSPIEMIRALSALANGGVLPNPHIVTGIKYESGITRSIDPGQGPRVFSTTTAATVTGMLQVVFDNALLNGTLKQQHYSFAAKTGTAQIPMPGGGYYPGDVYLHSFFGYFPASNPRFIVFLFAWKPVGQEYASATLAQPFMDIAQFLINYYNIPPDR
jgi:stage V sporulation protein D (sporulation-specific penicillin-binding protein)